MNDPNAGKYSKWFKDEFVIANLVLAPYNGDISWSNNDYEAFRFISEDVTLIFYPHTTSSTGNRHIRVRDQASKNTDLAHELIMRLHIGNGHWCTFTQKFHPYNQELNFAEEHGLTYGWAKDQIDNPIKQKAPKGRTNEG